MSIPVQEQTVVAQPAHRSPRLRTVLLIVLAILLTLFAVFNWQPVPVWPLGPNKPLTLVIGISFVLGALIGWLAHSVIYGRPFRRSL